MYKYRIVESDWTDGKVYGYILYDHNDIEVTRNGYWFKSGVKAGKLHLDAIEKIQADKEKRRKYWEN